MKKLLWFVLAIVLTIRVSAGDSEDNGYREEVLRFMKDSIDTKLNALQGPVVSGEEMMDLVYEIHYYQKFAKSSKQHMKDYWGWDWKGDYFNHLDPRINKIYDIYWHTFWDRDHGDQAAHLLSEVCGKKIDRVESHLSTFCLVAMIILFIIAVIFALNGYYNIDDYPRRLFKGIFKLLVAVAIIYWLFN